MQHRAKGKREENFTPMIVNFVSVCLENHDSLRPAKKSVQIVSLSSLSADIRQDS